MRLYLSREKLISVGVFCVSSIVSVAVFVSIVFCSVAVVSISLHLDGAERCDVLRRIVRRPDRADAEGQVSLVTRYRPHRDPDGAELLDRDRRVFGRRGHQAEG